MPEENNFSPLKARIHYTKFVVKKRILFLSRRLHVFQKSISEGTLIRHQRLCLYKKDITPRSPVPASLVLRSPVLSSLVALRRPKMHSSVRGKIICRGKFVVRQQGENLDRLKFHPNKFHLIR